MTKTEAVNVVAALVACFPGTKWGEENAEMYESAVAELGFDETRRAVGELAKASTFMPSIAELRNEVFRARKVARDRDAVPRLPQGSGFPGPEEWGRKLGHMLTDAERYERMAKRWYASKGKPYPGDPAQKILDTVKAGARGEHISEVLKSVVLGDMDEQDRRHP